MKKPRQKIRLEPRWPVAVTILAVLIVLTLLPARVRLFPFWVPYSMAVALLLPMAGVWLSGAGARWLSLERTSTLVVSILAEIGMVTSLMYLILGMLNRPAEFSGRQLLTSSVGAWFTNVLAFSLVYWRIDRGGPEARANELRIKPDWLFPQTGVLDQAPAHWRPTFIDYLYLSFSTATAFSSTDVLPLTSRAKILMMIESGVSLVSLVVVASRAINILGGR